MVAAEFITEGFLSVKVSMYFSGSSGKLSVQYVFPDASFKLRTMTNLVISRM